jgi:hypothetical protein
LPYLTNVDANSYTLTVTDVCDSSITQTFNVTHTPPLQFTNSPDTQVCAGTSLKMFVDVKNNTGADTRRILFATHGSPFGGPNGEIYSNAIKASNFSRKVAGDTLPFFRSMTGSGWEGYLLSSDGELAIYNVAMQSYRSVGNISGLVGAERPLEIAYDFRSQQVKLLTDSMRI